ncbi:MAG: adenylate/guanylate cyclase domain-containing protein, partial [Verrucomicrobiota bacterium]
MVESSAPQKSTGRAFSWYNLFAPIVLAILSLLLSGFVFMEILENMTLDQRIRLRAADQAAPDSRLMLIAIEESSEDVLGRWPWGRDVHAEFLQIVNPAKPAVYTFDVIFPTYTVTANNNDSGIATASVADLAFADACKSLNVPVVLGAVQIRESDLDRKFGQSIDVDTKLGWPASIEITNSDFNSADKVEISYSELLAHTASGLVNADPHSDGVVREIDMVAIIETPGVDQVVPSLALQTLIQFWKLDPAQHIRVVPGEAVYIDSPVVQRRIPINEKGRYAVNYRHSLKEYIDTNSAVSFIGVLQGYYELNFENNRLNNLPEIENKILLLGQTAVGMADMAESPFSPRAPLPMVHMNVLDNILNEDYMMKPPDWLTWLAFILIAYATLLPTARLGFWLKVIIPFIVLLIYLPVSYLAFELSSIHLEVVAPGLAFFILHVGSIGKQVLEERKAKEEMKRTFSAYVAPGIIDSIYSDPDKLQLGGAKKEVTILFTDIRSFTTMTENMDSEVLVAQLNEYFAEMVDSIMTQQGTLHKFIGDAIMAVWGDIKYSGPTIDAGLGLSSSLEMRNRLRKLNQSWKAEGRPEFHMGIGLNFGQVVVGNIGAPQRMEFTVIGDAVNLAARLESLNKQFGTEILVGESIYNLTHERFAFRFAGNIQVKGKGVAVPVYEALYEIGKENESPYSVEWIQLYSEATTRYFERRFDVAARLYEAC